MFSWFLVAQKKNTTGTTVLVCLFVLATVFHTSPFIFSIHFLGSGPVGDDDLWYLNIKRFALSFFLPPCLLLSYSPNAKYLLAPPSASKASKALPAVPEDLYTFLVIVIVPYKTAQ